MSSSSAITCSESTGKKRQRSEVEVASATLPDVSTRSRKLPEHASTSSCLDRFKEYYVTVERGAVGASCGFSPAAYRPSATSWAAVPQYGAPMTLFRDMTPEAQAQEHFIDLTGRGAVVRFSGIPGKASLLTTAEHDEFSELSPSERVAFIAPRFRQLAVPYGSSNDGCAVKKVLVDSRDLPWLLMTKQQVARLQTQWPDALAPDLFLSHEPFVSFENSSGQGSAAMASVPRGRLFSTALQSDGAVLAIVLSRDRANTKEDFHAAVEHCQCFHYPMRCLMFGAGEVWLIRSDLGLPTFVTICQWTTPGTEELVRDFLTSMAPCPVATVLEASLQKAGLRLLYTKRSKAVKPSKGVVSCYLGSGASGHVFAAQPAAATSSVGPATAATSESAIKIMLFSYAGPQEDAFQRELSALQTAAAAGAPVVRLRPKSYHWMELLPFPLVGGASYIMDTVGKPCNSSRIRKTVARGAVSALAALHRAGYVHGDARLANLLQVRSDGDEVSGADSGAAGDLVWIDLRRGRLLDELGEDAIRRAQREDATALALSITQHRLLTEDVLAAVADYDPSDKASVGALADILESSD